jgi:hypothetical protein
MLGLMLAILTLLYGCIVWLTCQKVPDTAGPNAHATPPKSWRSFFWFFGFHNQQGRPKAALLVHIVRKETTFDGLVAP